MIDQITQWFMRSFQQKPLTPLLFISGIFFIFLAVTSGFTVFSYQLVCDQNFRGIALFIGVSLCVAAIWDFYRQSKTTQKLEPNDHMPVAYAVLSYVLDKNYYFALLKDDYYKKIQPPGRQLKTGEQPHEIALSIASEELDLPIDELKRFPSIQERRCNYTRIVPPPYQVQLENNPGGHRTARKHYDFVYVFMIDRNSPDLNVRNSPENKFDPAWYSLRELESRKNLTEWGPHDDMLDTMKSIIDGMQSVRLYENSIENMIQWLRWFTSDFHKPLWQIRQSLNLLFQLSHCLLGQFHSCFVDCLNQGNDRLLTFEG